MPRLKKSFIRSGKISLEHALKGYKIRLFFSFVVALLLYLLLLGSLYYLSEGFEIKLPKQKEVMPIDMELVQEKKSEQKPPQKPKEFDEKINEDEGFSPQQKEDDTPPAPPQKPAKEIEKTSPAKPKEKPKPQPKQQPQPKKEAPKKQKTPPKEKEAKKTFPSMQELSDAMESQTRQEQTKEQEVQKDFALRKLYGKELDSMGQAQKKFLSTNMGSIQSITQRHLNRMGYPRVAVMARQSGENIVEFVLHPNGDITDLK
ncbi:MAG: hypothetical protein ACQESH_06230, partial [Campylobacterota bacterium]